MPFGFAGKILRVDLTSSATSEIPIEKYVPKYIGGRGIATRIYWEDVPPEVKPFDPENELIFMTGPLQGTIFPGSSRMSAVSKAAQTYPTESIGSSNIGSFFAPELKFAGYDGLIIQGKSPRPVYLWITDSRALILDAGWLWGLNTHDTQNEIWKKHGWQARVLVIGPAGENVCRSAIIISDAGSAFGLGSFGAVMGSKNLKAIATRGTGAVTIARPKEALELREYIDALHGPKPGDSVIGFKGKKLTGRRAAARINPYAPTNQTGVDGEPLLSTMADEIKQGIVTWRPTSCYACPGGCRSGIKIRGGGIPCGSAKCNILRAPAEVYNLYYHTRGIMSKNVWEWTQLHQTLGLNHHETPDGRTASSGGAVGSRLVENLIKAGILTEKNTGWPTDKYGSLEFSRQALVDIAWKRGFGKVWAEDICRAIDYITNHEEFGPNRNKALYYRDIVYPKAGNFNGYQSHYRHSSEGIHYANLLYYALSQGDGNRQHCAEYFYKGPRSLTPGTDEWKTLLAGVMKKYTGTDKPIGSPGFEECEKAVRWFWQQQMEMESLESCNARLQGWCEYTQDGISDFELGSKMLNVVTGWDWTQTELWAECERLWILERAIACREGRRASDDEFNDTWLKENPMAASADGTRFDRAKIREGLDRLYALVGWNRNGIPTRARLEELDLKDVADDLENRGVLVSE